MSTTRKVVVITGASQGIGAGLVRGFLDRGYRVVANSRFIKPDTASDILTISGDVADPARREAGPDGTECEVLEVVGGQSIGLAIDANGRERPCGEHEQASPHSLHRHHCARPRAEKGDGLYTSKPFGGPLQRLVFLREAEAQHRRSG